MMASSIEPSHGATSLGGTSLGGTSLGGTSLGGTSQRATSQRASPQGSSPQGATPQGASPQGTISLGATLLSGGRASRVDGAAKHLFEIGGRTLLAHAIGAAVDAGAQRILVVGPEPQTTGELAVEQKREGNSPPTGAESSQLTGARSVMPPAVDWIREDPPFGGPAAGIVAALAEWTSSSAGPAPEWILVLACDLPDVRPAVRRLMRDILLHPSDIDGICLADASSRPQWLTGVYRTSALSRAAATLPDAGRDASVRSLLADLAVAVISAPTEETTDVDTWQDLEDARQRARTPDTSVSPAPETGTAPESKESP